MPKVVGETAAGEPIYEVQSIRLSLRAGAAHFNRIVACAKCGSDVTGPSVLNAADLEHPANPILCKDCVQVASAGAPVPPAAPDAQDPDMPFPDTAAPAGAEQLSVDGARLAALEQRTAELARAHEDRLEQLHATFSTEGIRAGAAVDRVIQGSSELRESQVEIGRRLDEVTDRLGQLEGTTSGPPDALDARLEALEQRLEETVERLTERDEVQAELRVVLEGRVDQLVELVQQLQARIESDTSVAQSDSATLAQGNAELARIEEQLNQRIDGLAEKAARAGDTEAERRRALEKQVRGGLRRTAKALESHRRELKAELREQLAEVHAPVPTTASVSDNRLEALEERVERGDDEMSELGELHAALDVGLGALRSEIAEVRNAVKKVAGEQADVHDRLEDLDRAPRTAPPADSGRGRKPGRKADAGANLAVAIEAAEILAREHQQLKAQVAELEKAAEAAAATAARASSLATASGPIRSDVRLLQEQLAAQNEAIATLGRTVERLRRKGSTPAAAEPPSKPATKPASKPARKATKR